MLPAISAALAIADAIGLTDKVSGWVGAKTGLKAAEKVIQTASKLAIDSGYGDETAKSTEQLLGVLTRDKDFQLKLESELRNIEVDILRMELQDIADARSLQESALAQDDLFSKRFIYWFAIYWSAFSGIYIFCISFIAMPNGATRFADTVLGFLLGTALAGIFSFFYGSSAGSKDKTTAMLKELKDL